LWVRVAYRFIAPVQGFTDKDMNGTNNLLLITALGVDRPIERDFTCEPVNAG